MTLGEKLRQARLEAGLSQRQLCGGEITRNMLSQIEHGTAHPSMTTLRFLARQLGRPVSFFLEEEAEVSANRGCMDAAWEKFLRSDAAGALAALSDYQGPDPIYDRELSLLRPLVLLSLVETALQEGRLPYAAKLLDQVEEIPWLPELVLRKAGLLRKMGAQVPFDSLPEPDEWLMVYAHASLSDGDADRAAKFLDACKNRNASWHLLRGRAAMAAGDYALAVGWLKEAEKEYPESVIPLLEQAFRELGDYKSAYEYACKGRKKQAHHGKL